MGTLVKIRISRKDGNLEQDTSRTGMAVCWEKRRRKRKKREKGQSICDSEVVNYKEEARRT